MYGFWKKTRVSTLKNRGMCPQERRRKLTELTSKYRYAFFMIGSPNAGYNNLRLASFISTKKPKEYEIFIEDDHRTMVFWNPYEDEEAPVEQS